MQYCSLSKGEGIIRTFIFITILLAGVVSAGHSPVEITSPQPVSVSEWITYATESPACICWEGIFRGTWFSLNDFYPGATSWEIEQVAVWFDHSVSYPWDVSQVYAEIWSGGQSGPDQQLSQILTTAVDGGPTILSYPASISAGNDFWVMINTEFSGGGWPSNLGDTESSMSVSHSFYSDNFVSWEPWLIEGNISNYAVFVDMTALGFDGMSWGELKTIF